MVPDEFTDKVGRAKVHVRQRARAALERAGGNKAEAARLLWQWSRQDEVLKEALAKVAAVSAFGDRL